MASILVSAAVVVADVVLAWAFVHYLPGAIPTRWMILLAAGILGIVLFALRRLVLYIRLFRRDE
jgi:hypothetical protein